MNEALLVIDMIKDFVTGEFENERAQKIVPNISELMDAARSSGLPVIYVSDTHPEGDHEFSVWGEHAVAGSEGSEMIPELKPKEGDYRLEKEKFSAFFKTNLDTLLKDLDVEGVILTGVLTHICIQHTAADAFFRGYNITVPKGCVDDLSDEANERSLEFMEENYGVDVIDYQNLIEKF